MSEGLLAGRVCVVTGAGRGIGAACARRLAANGAQVVLASRGAGDLERVAAEVRAAGGAALAVPTDVGREDEVEALFAAADGLGPLEVLVNDAAVLRLGAIHEQSLADWDEQLRVNLTGPFLCARAALRRMRPRRRGVIVNVASVSGLSGVDKLPGLCGYAASKGGLLTFSEALAAEQADAGIRVVAVSPGSTNTPMLAAAAGAEVAAQAMAPEAVAEVVAFLASDAAAAVTKTNVTVWGPPR